MGVIGGGVASSWSAYVEQARVTRCLRRCGRGSGIAGGLDGEARSAFGEQELRMVGSACLYWGGWESTKKGFIHVASFFYRGLTLDRDYRAFDQGYRVKQKRCFVSVVS
jgi:hypothetical protein